MTTLAAGQPEHRSALEKLALAVEIVRTCLAVRRRLRRDGLPPTLDWLRAPLAQGTHPADASILALGRAVRRALAPLPADTRCLTQSLVLLGLLARRGVPAVLVLGVETTGARFGAHAWIEHEQRPLLPPGTNPARRLAEL